MGKYICKACGKPVMKNKDRYEIFEHMHYLCFHLEYEHGEYDPDEKCNTPGCMWDHSQ